MVEVNYHAYSYDTCIFKCIPTLGSLRIKGLFWPSLLITPFILYTYFINLWQKDSFCSLKRKILGLRKYLHSWVHFARLEKELSKQQKMITPQTVEWQWRKCAKVYIDLNLDWNNEAHSAVYCAVYQSILKNWCISNSVN